MKKWKGERLDDGHGALRGQERTLQFGNTNQGYLDGVWCPYFWLTYSRAVTHIRIKIEKEVKIYGLKFYKTLAEAAPPHQEKGNLLWPFFSRNSKAL